VGGHAKLGPSMSLYFLKEGLIGRAMHCDPPQIFQKKRMRRLGNPVFRHYGARKIKVLCFFYSKLRVSKKIE